MMPRGMLVAGMSLAVFVCSYSAAHSDSVEIERWWQPKGGHRDENLLVQSVSLNECVSVADEADIKHREWQDLAVGAVVHPHRRAIRAEDWSEDPFKNSVAVSIVPYLVAAEKRYYLVPHSISSEFKRFYPLCSDGEGVLFKKYMAYPAYYPTIELSSAGWSASSDQAHMLEHLKERAAESPLEILESPIPITNQDLPQKMGQVIRHVFSQRSSQEELAFLNGLLEKIRSGVIIKPSGFGKIARYDDGSILGRTSPFESFVYRKRRATQITEDPPERDAEVESRGAGEIETLRVFLSTGLQETLGLMRSSSDTSPAGVDIQIDGCTRQSDAPAPKFDCRGVPGSGRDLHIAGVIAGTFKPVDGEIAVEEKDLRVKVQVNAARSYWLEGDEVSGQQSVWLDFDEISSDYRFQVERDRASYCDLIQRFELQDAVEKKVIDLADPCRRVTLTWPPQWGAPAAGGVECVRQEGSRVERGSLRCFVNLSVSNLEPVALRWSDAWQPIIIGPDLLRQKTGGKLDLEERLRPRWPFAADNPRLTSEESVQRTEDRCSGEPVYRIKTVTYANGSRRKTSAAAVALGAESLPGLPSLGEIGWNRGSSVPSEILVDVEQVGVPRSLVYKEKHTIRWLIADVSADPLGFERHRVAMQQHFPIRAMEQPEVPYDDRIFVEIFDDLAQCQGAAGGRGGDRFYYSPAGFVGMRASLCDYVRLYRHQEGKPGSACLQPQLTEDGNAVVLNFPAIACTGKNYLVAVALASGLNDFGLALQDTLLRAFDSVRQQGARRRFAFITINAGRRLNLEFGCEDLQSLPGGVALSMQDIIHSLAFGAEDLRALGDLALISAQFSDIEELGGVLYLIDGKRMGAFSSQALGPALDWHVNQIPFKVLTLGDCALWRERAKAECVKLEGLEQLEREIVGLLGGI